MIVVLDTNVLASATFWRGKPALCLEAWVSGKFDLAVSHPILTEYEEVIGRLSARYPEKDPTDWLRAIKSAAHLYLPSALPLATPDPDDQIFIERAVVSRASYLVTGDKGHLLNLKTYQGISILPASEFIRLPFISKKSF